MNKYPLDRPYIFKPPKFSSLWWPLFCFISDNLYMRREHKVRTVSSSGHEVFLQAQKDGHSVLITPNHPDHSDPHVLMHLSRGWGLPFHYMAAQEIFDVNNGFNGWFLQRAGVFSINRDGSDLRSIKTALEILDAGKYPLVIFPEGEIYHTNERLTPLNDGAAAMALRIGRKLGKEGRKVFIFPVALKYLYREDISSFFPGMLDELESHILWKPQRHLSVVDRIYKLGDAVLALKEKEFCDTITEGSLEKRLQAIQERLVRKAEEAFCLPLQPEATHPERIRRVRGKIREKLLSAGPITTPEMDICQRTLDELHFAFQLYSYPSRYLSDSPTQGRIAETLIKLEEDLLRRYCIRGNRAVEAVFGEPIDVSLYLNDYKTNTAQATRKLTEDIEQIIRRHL
jgi:1-acyl-sn-glycerol-3-phosphate acyltransferase